MQTRLRFDYVNWRGDIHSYLVTPTTLVFSQCRCFAEDDERLTWNLNAQVHERDGEPRPTIRTFALQKITNLEEVPGS